MRKLFVLLFLLIAPLSVVANAQTFATITGSNIGDGGGNATLSGKLCFSPTDNTGNPIAIRGVGQIVARPQCVPVIGGVITPASGGTFQLLNTATSYPTNFCWAASLQTQSGTLPATGYSCMQMNSNWCTTSGGVETCDFDNYPPNSVSQAAVIAPQVSIGTVTQLAPGATPTASVTGTPPNFAINFGLVPGNNGAAGTANWRGAWTATTSYGQNDAYVQAGQGYIVSTAYTSGATFGSTDTSHAVATALANLNTGAVGSPAIYTAAGAIGTSLPNLAILGVGDSRMAGANVLCFNSPHDGSSLISTCGSNGYQDFLSVLVRQSNFVNRVAYSYNDGVNGTACPQMTSNFSSANLQNYAPGGSSAPNATQTLIFILTGQNDVTQNGETLAQYQSCMGAFINTVTALGMTPVLITSYWSPLNTTAEATQLDAYNDWQRGMAGTVINGQRVRVIDADKIVGHQSSGWMYLAFNNPSLTLYPFSGATVSGGVLTFTTSASASLTTQLASNVNPVECGGFQTATGLNYAKATYLSGAGTQTLSFTLATPIANVTTSDTGACWSTITTGGIHLGPDGVKMLAEAANDEFGLSGIGTRAASSPVTDYVTPKSGTSTTNGSVCALNNAVGVPSNGCYPAASGTLITTTIQANLTPSQAGFYAGQGRLSFGPNGADNTYISATGTLISIHGALYTGAAGAIGTAFVNNGGSGYALLDTGSIAGAGSGATYSVIGITVNGACQYFGTTAYIGTGPACLLLVTAGGATYAQATAATTTAITGSGTGMTVNTLLSASQAFSAQAAGFVFNGGSLRVSGLGVPAYAQDSTYNSGEVASATGGLISAAHVSSGTSTTGCYVTGDTVTLGGYGANATATVTATSCTVTALTITSGGNKYIVDGVVHATTGGSGTGLTYTPSTTTALGGRIRFGSSFLLADDGLIGAIWNPSGPVQISKPVGNNVSGTLAAGAAAGTSPTVTCLSGHKCSSSSGTVTLVVGTSPTTGALLTITDTTTTRTNFPDCTAHIILTASPFTEASNYQFTYTTQISTLNIGTALTASTSYTITYSCFGY